MQPNHVLSHIDPEEIARDTLEFIRVKSETGQEGDGSRFLADLLRREGLDVQLDEVEPGRPNVYALLPGSSRSRAPALLFNGHTDTIPIGRSAAPARDGDWIIGRGAEDMKGGLVAMVHAAAALRKAGVRLGGDLWLTGVIDHETPAGKKAGPRRLVQHLRSGEMKADAIVIVEGPHAIWAASLGSAVYTITIRSDLGPIHTVKVPYANNPVCWLGKLLTRFEEMERRFESAPKHPLCGREQINVGIVKGGDYMNRLPTPVSVSGMRRWTPGKTVADIRGEFQKLCDEFAAASGLAFSFTLEGNRGRCGTPAGHAVGRGLLSAGEGITGKRPQILGMALVGDPNIYANDGGVPPVYYGPAHETAHSDHERVSAARLVECAKVYALAALAFCGSD